MVAVLDYLQDEGDVEVQVVLVDVFLDDVFLECLCESFGFGCVVVVDVSDDEQQFVVVHMPDIGYHCIYGALKDLAGVVFFEVRGEEDGLGYF